MRLDRSICVFAGKIRYVNDVRRLVGLVIAVVALLAASSSDASAGALMVGDLIKLFDGPGNVNAGEFIVRGAADGYSTELFRTFCVQINEDAAYDEAMLVGGISNTIQAGGSPLMARTSALYREFERGAALAGDVSNYTTSFMGTSYTFNETHNESVTSDASMLQNAIWYFQNEISYADAGGASNQFIAAANAVSSYYGWDANLQAIDISGGADLYGGVQVLNLMRDITGNETNFDTNAQDQLYFAGVPEPSTFCVFGIGFVGLAWRFRRASAVGCSEHV